MFCEDARRASAVSAALYTAPWVMYPLAHGRRDGRVACKGARMNHADHPLHAGDTATQTVGCRRSNPGTCMKHSLRAVCAFVRVDGICLEPPKTWPRTFRRLTADAA